MDAYVRDGTYAATNYGTVNSLVVKNSSSGYTRTSYLQFDVSAFSSPVSEAKIRLVPTYVGAASNVNAIAVATGNWTETDIVWNNKPSTGTVIGDWTGMAVGVPVEINVTAQVNAAITAGDSLSLTVYNPSSTGNNGDVVYGSKEQMLASACPVLAIIQ